MTEFILIVGMLAATYFVRLLPFALADRMRLPAILENALQYVPIAVLSAIIAPAVCLPEGYFWIDWKNPYLMAGLVSVIAAAIGRNLVITIFAGMATALSIKFLIV